MEVKAQVMTRDNVLGMWVPHSGGGMSRVGLFQAPDAAAEADLGHIQYVISGYKMSDDVVSTFTHLLLTVVHSVCPGHVQQEKKLFQNLH